MPSDTEAIRFRLIEAGDCAPVRRLIDADRLTGQPETTEQMLADALAGQSEIDAAWWEELDPPVTEVAHDQFGQILGVISYAHRTDQDTDLILWMHCREDPDLAAALVDRARSQLKAATILAFDFSSALTRGLEGLPARARPATYKALIEAGFTGIDAWRYIHLVRERPADKATANGITITPSTETAGEVLTYAPDGTIVGSATIGEPRHGVGVLWWISIEPEHRSHGYGRALLLAALDELAHIGADVVIGYVDDGTPTGQEERSAANHLYDQTGFNEIDRLHTFVYRR